MKSAGLPLLFLALAAPFVAQETPAAAPARTSLRLKQEIQDSLPKYSPPPPRPLDQPNTPVSDPDLFELPAMTVREKIPPRIQPDDLLSRKTLNKKLAREYRDSLSGLDSLLNRFTIPVFSASPAERGRALRLKRTFEDAGRISEIGRQADAGNSASLDADVNKTQKDLDWRNRPAGDGRKK